MASYWQFVRLVKKELYGALFGIFMSFIATFSSIALMGTATWFLSAMAVCGFYDVVLNIFIPSALIRLLALSRTLLRYGERYYTHDATFRLIAYLRVFLFERALDLKIEDALRLKSSDLQRRMQSDLERLEMIYVRQGVPFACAFLMGLVVGGVLLAFSPLMAFTALSLMLVSGVILPYVLTRFAYNYSQMQSSLAISMNNDMSDFIHGFFDLVLLGKHYERAQSFLHAARALAKSRAQIIFYDQLAQVFLMTFSELTLFLLLIQGVPLVVAGEISGPQMMMLSVAAMASYEVLVPLSAAFLNLPYVAHSATRVSSLLNITKDNADINPNLEALVKAEDDYTSAASMAASGGALSRFSSLSTNQAQAKLEARDSVLQSVNVVSLKDVGFSYTLNDGQELQVLKDFSYSFSSECNYLIKAPSGHGKSTLVLLLTSLLYPKSGELYFNDVPYRELKSSQIRSCFATALQDIALFSGTILETFRQIKPQVSQEEIMQALEIVELNELIDELPNGLDEWLGSTGLTISGGQARRLCLARALVAAGPSDNGKFLILDEPGEGLDEAQEVRIIERIQQLRKGVVIITHKNAGARLAEHVLNL